MSTLTYAITEDAVKTVERALNKAAKSIDLKFTFSEITSKVVNQYALVLGANDRTEKVKIGSYLRSVKILTLEMPELENEVYKVLAVRGYAPDSSEVITNWRGDYRDLSAFTSTTKVNECAHCKANRLRTNVFIIEERATSRIFQVGGSCRQYYVTAAMIKAVEAMSLVNQVIVDSRCLEEDDFGGEGSFPEARMFMLGHAVSHCISHIKNEGFNPKYNGEQRNYNCTADKVRDCVNYYTNYSQYEPKTAQVIAELRNPEGSYFMGGDVMYDWVNFHLIYQLAGAVSRILSYLAKKEAHIDEALVMPTEGRQKIAGKVVSMRTYETMYGNIERMLVDCGGYKLFGSVPSSVSIRVNDLIEMQAAVEPKELGFGYFKRPTKTVVVN